MKQISKKEAREKYGVSTEGINSMYDYFLREDGCVVDSNGDRRFIPPYQKGMYVAMATVTAENGKAVTTITSSRMIEYAKKDAMDHVTHLCRNEWLPKGNVFVKLEVTQDDEYIDSDETDAQWDGNKLKFYEGLK